MPYPTDIKEYDREEVLRVAEEHYVGRKTHQQVAELLGIYPRARVMAMCEAARKAGLVQIAIMPSRSSEAGRLRDLAADVRSKYKLKDCILVPGHYGLLKRYQTGMLSDAENVREVIIDNITKEAALQVDRYLGLLDNPVLAITYGFVSRKICDYLRPLAGLGKRGVVVAAQGATSPNIDRFDANNIVHDVAHQYGYEYKCLLVPAFVGNLATTVTELPFVKDAVDTLAHQTNIVVGSIAAGPISGIQAKLDDQLIELSDEERDMGNFGGWRFDGKGEPLAYTERTIIGLGLRRMKELVKQDKPVILAVGADLERAKALKTAISCKEPFCNIWIGDEASARYLLG